MISRRNFVGAATAALASKSHAVIPSYFDYDFPLQDVEATSLSGGVITLSRSSLLDLRRELRGKLLVFGSQGYQNARRVWNGAVNRTPGVIVRCESVGDVVHAVNFASKNSLLTAVRGGGHSFSGSSVCDGGLMIDLSCMDYAQLNVSAKTINAGPGATFGSVYREAVNWRQMVIGGPVSALGVGGFNLGGGMGRLSRKHGLGCDNLRSLNIVTPDGKFRKVNEGNYRDLYWALQGGCGNFGVVTNFEIQTHAFHPTIMTALVVYPWRQAKDVFSFFAEFTQNAPDEVSTYLYCFQLENAGLALALDVIYGEAPSTKGNHLSKTDHLFKALRRFGSPLQADFSAQHWMKVHTANDHSHPAGEMYYKRDIFAESLSEDISAALIELFPFSPGRNFVTIGHLGGAVARRRAADSAFAHRNARYSMEFATQTTDPDIHSRNRQWADEIGDAVRLYASGFSYENFWPGEGSGRIAFGSNYQKLVQVKQRYDPQNLFRMNANIDPGH